MKITIIGSGYVGLVSGVCFASLGHDVVCVDKDEKKILALKNCNIPIFEPGLDKLLARVVLQNKISFTVNLKEALHNSSVVFIAVGTPQGEDGSADLSYVMSAAEEIANLSDSSKLIVTKSTVPPKTAHKIKDLVRKNNPHLEFFVASNPEFLREGCAIEDFMKPDRIILGSEDEKSKNILSEIYSSFPPEKILHCDVVTAELIKYASNSFLATKISFINEIADLCEVIGGDIKNLAKGVGLDLRIGEKFLNPGPGFGGSCFPKDIAALSNIAKENNSELSLIDSVISSNFKRRDKMVKKILAAFTNNEVVGKKIAFLGLAFKSNTDDIRYSPAISIIRGLAKSGAKIVAHDFAAIENARNELKDLQNVSFCEDVYDALKDVDLIVIATEWQQYCELDFGKIKQLTKSRKVIDLRNLFDAKKMTEEGFEYSYIGSKS